MTLVKYNDGNTGLRRRVFRHDPVFSLFDKLFDNNEQWSDYHAGSLPPVNILESDIDYTIELAVPGLNKKDIIITLDKNVLTVSTEKEDKDGKEENDFTRREFIYSAFNRSFTLPKSADQEKINAYYKNGLLTISIPKKKEAVNKPPRKIAIS